MANHYTLHHHRFTESSQSTARASSRNGFHDESRNTIDNFNPTFNSTSIWVWKRLFIQNDTKWVRHTGLQHNLCEYKCWCCCKSGRRKRRSILPSRLFGLSSFHSLILLSFYVSAGVAQLWRSIEATTAHRTINLLTIKRCSVSQWWNDE